LTEVEEYRAARLSALQTAVLRVAADMGLNTTIAYHDWHARMDAVTARVPDIDKGFDRDVWSSAARQRLRRHPTLTRRSSGCVPRGRPRSPSGSTAIGGCFGHRRRGRDS
jgi:hypothetical protein